MGITFNWHEDVISSIKLLNIEVEILEDTNYSLLVLGADRLLVNLVNLHTCHSANDFILLQDQFLTRGKQMVHLWEDVWRTRKVQVLSRLQSMLGLNSRIHARKTQIISITQPQADQFMYENHLQLSVKARYKYALVVGTELYAVACFSGLRKMKNKNFPYKSAELIRFANLNGYTVTGGFTKLLQHFIRMHRPNDLMSYADRDWSLGAAYLRAGFNLAETTSPLTILVHRHTMERSFPHRVAEEQTSGFVEVFNTGNLKYILDL
ncbi:hypothetical protein ACXZ1K_10385 [Pedobacter sp. PWIIR3]